MKWFRLSQETIYMVQAENFKGALDKLDRLNTMHEIAKPINHPDIYIETSDVTLVDWRGRYNDELR